jgi:hypothetical protein
VQFLKAFSGGVIPVMLLNWREKPGDITLKYIIQVDDQDHF